MKYFNKIAANALAKRINDGRIPIEDGLRIYDSVPEYNRKPIGLKERVGGGWEGNVFKAMHPKAKGKLATIKHYAPASPYYSQRALQLKEQVLTENSGQRFMPEFYGTHKDNKNIHFMEYISGNGHDQKKANRAADILNKKYENEIYAIRDITGNKGNFRDGKLIDFIVSDSHSRQKYKRANAVFKGPKKGAPHYRVGDSWVAPVKEYRKGLELEHKFFNTKPMKYLDKLYSTIKGVK